MTSQPAGTEPVLVIVGPTASGKSALAVSLAQRLDAEIISADSMQVYIGMNIGTATPTLAERGGITHHMLDIWDPAHPVSVAEFQQHARAAIDAVRGRGKRVIVVGGSGLYVSAVMDDLQFPGTVPQVRARLEAQAGALGAEAMHARLRELDPSSAHVILPSNTRRIVRALEVIEITGKPFAATLPPPTDVYSAVRVGLQVDRAVMDRRIAHRVHAMWDAGLEAEVASLMAQGLPATHTAIKALGYAQAIAYLSDHISREQAIAETITATGKFARRQQRWFARDTRIQWVPHDGSDTPDVVRELWATLT